MLYIIYVLYIYIYIYVRESFMKGKEHMDVLNQEMETAW